MLNVPPPSDDSMKTILGLLVDHRIGPVDYGVVNDEVAPYG